MDHLSTADIAKLLRASQAEITAEVSALSDELAGWHPAAGEWCVKECLGHLVEAERRGFAGRIRDLLEREPNSLLVPWDQVAVARARNDCAAAAGALLQEFADERAASVALVELLRPSDLELGGEHPQVGHLTVSEIANEWVHHDRNHFKQLLTNIQDFAWQQMGNARKFSLPH